MDSSRKALGVVNQLVQKCNEETKKVQRMQELIEIEKILQFRSKIKSYPIVSGARYLGFNNFNKKIQSYWYFNLSFFFYNKTQIL